MRSRIILLGDSITELSFADGGWGASLTNHFSRSLDVVLRGYSGYNTRWVLKVIEKICSNGDPPIAMTIFFGANDASLPDRTSAFQHVPLHEYKLNLHSIISFIKIKWPTTLILLITPPPVDEDGRIRNPFGENPSGLPERTNDAAGAYAKVCEEVANESGVGLVDLWTKMQQIPNWEKTCLCDGLHLTTSGNKIVFEEIMEKLKQGGISLETLPPDLPLMSQIDPRDPLKVFEN